ncbi:MAG TPA: aminotransferase class I/II-fold pyridoxal phosphate-dependent enzyme [Acidobacteriota bacterium]|nr:aminotransferase class I/II-fold pyridoxal phosphate-dependent enzyme [Acidobacteriota bacterium]
MAKPKMSSTVCVHGGVKPVELSGPIITPIVHCAPFAFNSTAEVIEFQEGRSSRRQPEYGRMGNPTVACVESRLAALEGAERALLFASGMAAVTSLLLSLLKSGDHVVMTRDSYRRTRDFCTTFLSKFGVEVTLVDPSLCEIEKALRPSTVMIFSESPTNPYLHVMDIEGLARLGKNQGRLTVVDSTFGTPFNIRPIELGIDLVIHSATKYLGGHNDLISGVVAGSEELLQPLAEMRSNLGGITDPNTAFLLERGLKTLALRMERHNANGLALAQFLESHPKVRRVYYPGLPSHPHHEIAKQQMAGFGGVVSFEIDGDLEKTARFIDQLNLPHLTPSLGGVESLVEQVVVMSYWQMPKEEREKLGLKDNLVRYSLGIENIEDIVRDVAQALDKI